ARYTVYFFPASSSTIGCKPNFSNTASSFSPYFKHCTAKESRNICGDTRFFIPAVCTTCAMIKRIPRDEYGKRRSVVVYFVLYSSKTVFVSWDKGKNRSLCSFSAIYLICTSGVKRLSKCKSSSFSLRNSSSV